MESLKEREAPRGAGEHVYDEAVRIVMETGNASVSQLQRRLGISYSGAGQLVDRMEEDKLIGPYVGSKARDILVDRDGWLRELLGKDTVDRKGTTPVAGNNQDLMVSIVRDFESIAKIAGLSLRVVSIESSGTCHILEVESRGKEASNAVHRKLQDVGRDFSEKSDLRLISVIQGKISFFMVFNS